MPSLTPEQRSAAARKAWETMRAFGIRPPAKPPRPKFTLTGEESLLGAIYKLGGLGFGDDLAGERKIFMQSTAGRRPGLFRKRARLTWEEMIETVNSEGYGPFQSEREFFNAVDDEVRGLRKYHSANRNWETASADDWREYADDMARRGLCAHCGQHLTESESSNDYTGI
jgi:hypothetical protein